ncbi:MAG: hypothetical protein WCB62_14920 [Pseudolabrys sp.]
MPKEIQEPTRCFIRWRWFRWASRLAFSRQLGCDRSKELDWLIHHQAQGMVMRKRKGDEWVCHDFPICTCGRASEIPPNRFTDAAQTQSMLAIVR